MNNLNRPKKQKKKEKLDDDETLSVATIKAGNRSTGKKVTWRDPQKSKMAAISSESLKKEMDKQFENLLWPFIAPLLESIPDGQSDMRTALVHHLNGLAIVLGNGNLIFFPLAEFYSSNGVTVTPALSKAIEAFYRLASTQSTLALRRFLEAHTRRFRIGDNASISALSSATPSIGEISHGHGAIHRDDAGILFRATIFEGIRDIVLPSSRSESTGGSSLDFNADEMMDSQVSQVKPPLQGSGTLSRRRSL